MTPKVRESWAPYLGLRSAELGLRTLTRRGAYRLTRPLAAVLTVVWRAHFRGLQANLDVVRPDLTSAARRRLLRANVRNFLKAWIDVLQMPHRPTRVWREWLCTEGYENLTAARELGRGVIIVSFHLGAWESVIASLNDVFPGLALLAERVRPIRCFNWLERTRTRAGCRVIPLDCDAARAGDLAAAQRSGAASARAVYRVLRQQGVVVIAIDRDLLGTGETLPFFGHRASIPLGAAEIAARTGAVILPVTIVRSPHDTYLARAYPPVTVPLGQTDPATIRAVTRQLLELLEPVVAAHPEQWHVMSPIFGSPVDPGAADTSITGALGRPTLAASIVPGPAPAGRETL
ncbi:MAG TPA: hypothetical protein VMW47_02640 [Verrucomicrobiae bacterium]|nr:hypothetical protein [Verrucomicrobiae bacterium]